MFKFCSTTTVFKITLFSKDQNPKQLLMHVAKFNNYVCNVAQKKKRLVIPGRDPLKFKNKNNHIMVI